MKFTCGNCDAKYSSLRLFIDSEDLLFTCSDFKGFKEQLTKQKLHESLLNEKFKFYCKKCYQVKILQLELIDEHIQNQKAKYKKKSVTKCIPVQKQIEERCSKVFQIHDKLKSFYEVDKLHILNKSITDTQAKIESLIQEFTYQFENESLTLLVNDINSCKDKYKKIQKLQSNILQQYESFGLEGCQAEITEFQKLFEKQLGRIKYDDKINLLSELRQINETVDIHTIMDWEDIAKLK
ncbi:hypothetical protein OXYTRIMIC_411 [Oxytricha trifallax]|uniref:Uncharacterized protein n=1 Tax=Oxytricha trifallax TaxID=1172189 RepID=A0A073HZL8_9SPIT|nr:hypothetical protein OXYTRIMIC_411 [Oxytricha trifallax]